VFLQMKARGIKPNVVTFASLARPSAHNGDWQEVESIAKEMESYGLAVNEYFLYTLLISYASTRPRQVDRAESAFRRAMANGVEANKHVMGALARAVGRPRAHELMRECNDTMAASRSLPLPPWRQAQYGRGDRDEAKW